MSCIRHSYERGQPKGARVCKNCQCKEGEPTPHPRGNIVITGQTGITSVSTDMIDAPKCTPDPIAPIVNVETHSNLGASSAERWMECPGSANLSAYVKTANPNTEPDPEWTQDGTEAHAMALYVLSNDIPEVWMAMDPIKFPRVTVDMTKAVQVYVDYVRSLNGRKRYEVKLHAEKLHPLMYGTIDCEATSATGALIALEITDYKNGAGVFVPIENNVQLMYYACLVIYEDESFFLGSDRVRLTIAQPNHHSGNPIRSWDITVHDLKVWLHEELLPAMARATVGSYLSLGKWCQFCPAKIVCPAMRQLATKFSLGKDVVGLSDEELGRVYEEARVVRFYLKAIEAEVYKRLMNRHEVPGVKLVYGRADRQWKEGAELAADSLYPEELIFTTKFISPAQFEKVPGGKEFVAEWAYKPEAGLNVAYADDPKPAVVPKTGSELLANMRVDKGEAV